MKTIEFKDMIGKTLPFYGVYGKRFKIGKYVFNCVELPAFLIGSYRLHQVVFVAKQDKGGNFPRCLARVVIEEINRKTWTRKPDEPVRNVDTGYRLVDVKTGHIWLQMGTDYEDDYYPSFVFDYNPPEKTKCPHCHKTF